MWFFVLILILLLLTWAIAASFYLWRFVRIVWILEDGFSEATDVLQKAENTIDECLQTPMFFDSPQVQFATSEALDQIRVAKVSIAGLTRKFTQYSRHKYIEIVEDDKG